MKCPFELPVHINVIPCFSDEEVAYIVHAINSHEKLIKIKEISYEAICTGDQEALDEAIGLIEDFEETLFHKEAEKE